MYLLQRVSSVREVKLSNISQCIIYEISLRNCKRYVGVVYRSPSQDNAEFENFLSDFDELLNKTVSSYSLLTIILGDFNAWSSSWWNKDLTTAEGAHSEALTFLHNLFHLISEPTHLLPHFNFCIDLIFIDQSYIVVNCGTHASLNSKCHHQVTQCKLKVGLSPSKKIYLLQW